MSSLKLKGILSIVLCLTLPTFFFSQSNFLLRGVILKDTFSFNPIENAMIGIEDSDKKAFSSEEGVIELVLDEVDLQKKIKLSINDSSIFLISQYPDSGWIVSTEFFTAYFQIFNLINDTYSFQEFNDAYSELSFDRDGLIDEMDMLNQEFIDSLIILNDSILLLDRSDIDVVMEIKQFPTNFPVPSAMYCIPWEEFKIAGNKSYSKIDKKLTSALTRFEFGYSYYGFKNGFALVTQMEQINNDGTPLPGSIRFSETIEGPHYFTDYFVSLFDAPEGYFRCFVFLVTDVSVLPNQSDQNSFDQKEAKKFAARGYNSLPDIEYPFSENHRITVLVYHYRKIQGRNAELISNSFSAKVHLKKSGLYEKFSN